MNDMGWESKRTTPDRGIRLAEGNVQNAKVSDTFSLKEEGGKVQQSDKQKKT